MKYKDFYKIDEDLHIDFTRSIQFRKDLIEFFKSAVEKGYIKSEHKPLTTTDYKPIDWVEGFSDKFLNDLESYLITMNKQGDRNL